jgi:hypothetical protein
MAHDIEKCNYRFDEFYARIGEKIWQMQRPVAYICHALNHITVTNMANCFRLLFYIDESKISINSTRFATKSIIGHFWRRKDEYKDISNCLRRELGRLRFNGSRHIMDIDDKEVLYSRQYKVPLACFKIGLIAGLCPTGAGQEFAHHALFIDRQLKPLRKIFLEQNIYPNIDPIPPKFGPNSSKDFIPDLPNMLNPDWSLREDEIVKLCFISKFTPKSKHTQRISGVINRLLKTVKTSKVSSPGLMTYPRKRHKTDKPAMIDYKLLKIYPEYLRKHFGEDDYFNSDFKDIVKRELVIRLLQN